MTQKIVHADIEGFTDRLVSAIEQGMTVKPAAENGSHAEISRKTWKGAGCDACNPYRDDQLDPDARTVLLLELMKRWQQAHNKVTAAYAAELEKIADEKQELEAMATEQFKGVVHVRNNSTLGHKVENAQAAMESWRHQGYSVAPMPADDQPHAYDKPCPVCSGERPA
jgi:hypothetical protein